MSHLHLITSLANFGQLFGFDGFVVLVIGLLLFGRKLPEVARNLRHTWVELKTNDDPAVLFFVLISLGFLALYLLLKLAN